MTQAFTNPADNGISQAAALSAVARPSDSTLSRNPSHSMRRDLEEAMLQPTGEAPTNVVPFPVPSGPAGRADDAAARLDGMLDSEGYFTQSDEEFLTDLGLFDSTFMPPLG